MKKWKRSLFFWILVIAFFITAPAVILRARGYRFDFDRGIFVYSGSITIKSNPQDIDVVLDGKLNESKKIDRINSASQISSLMPGEYDLEVTSPGFRTWKKKIQIKSGLSTEFWNVLLTRENYEKFSHALEGSDRFFISPKTDQLASIRHRDNEFRIDIFDIEEDIVVKSFSFSDLRFLPQAEKENIEWSPKNSQHISTPIIKIAKEKTEDDLEMDNKDYLILNLDTEEFFYLEEFLDVSFIENVRWHPQKENYLFFISENRLYQGNIQDLKDLIVISEDVSAFNFSGSYIYFSQASNQIVHRKNLDNLAEEQTEQITNTFPSGEERTKIDKLIIYDKERIAFLEENKDLYIFNQGERDNYFKKLASDAEGLHFSDDGKKILFWTNNEISVYFLRNWDVQPTREEDEMINIARYLNSIENVQWFSDYEHVLFNTGPFVKIIELDSRDKRNSMDVLTIDNNFHFFTFDSLLEKLFFIGKNNSLYSIDFPEPVGILGF